MNAVVLSLALLAAIISVNQVRAAGKPRLDPELAAYVASRVGEFDQIPPERVETLRRLADYVVARRGAGQPVKLTFICTHNSRRSHMAQLWAAAAAAHYGIDGVETYSGGTDRTAFNPRTAAALRRAGFDVAEPSTLLQPDNPRYTVSYAPGAAPLTCFSKVYNEPPNPRTEYCAVMTCTEADDKCPVVEGAELRLALPFEDPKAADDTPEEAAAYDERCAQIAREMLLVFREAEQSLRRTN